MNSFDNSISSGCCALTLAFCSFNQTNAFVIVDSLRAQDLTHVRFLNSSLIPDGLGNNSTSRPVM